MKVRNLLLCLWLLLSIGVGAACAQDDQQQQRQQAVEKLRKYLGLEQEIRKLLVEKKWEEVIAKCREQAEILPKAWGPVYNIACAQARLGRTEEAFKSLDQSVEMGLNDPAHVSEDEDLEGLRADKRFAELVAKVRQTELKAGGAAYDKGAEMQGVKTVEDFPQGGLRYRIRMSPDATKEKPNRLIIWLHPAGGSMNGVVERLAPRFIEKNFALAVFTQKDWRAWNASDATRLLKRTLPALDKVEGLDAAKPVLLGYSAGGQIAIHLWRAAPEKWGGMVLNAAYPVQIIPPRTVRVLGPSRKEERKEVPVFAFVGANDQGTQLWQRVGPLWQKWNVPLRVDIVPDKGHTWLMGDFQLAALDGWLSDVAAGKIPASLPIEGGVEPTGEIPMPDDKPENPDGDTTPQPPEFNP